MLLTLTARSKARVVYFLGMAKNAGKTEAFNTLIREVSSAGLSLGLTSVGWDGELLDRLFLHAKPRIRAPKDSLCATSQAVLEKNAAAIKIVFKTKYRSLFGPLVIAKLHSDSEIELTGPLWGSQLKEVIDYLKKANSDLILIDGAIDRWAAAAPSLSDGCILSTGAILNMDMTAAIKQTKDFVAQLTLPQVNDAKLFQIAENIIHHADTAIVTKDHHIEPFDIPVSSNDISLPDSTSAIVFGGRIPNHILLGLIHRHDLAKLTLITKDPTHIFAEPHSLTTFFEHGGCIEVLYPINVIAITANPISPLGWQFPSRHFVKELALSIPGIPILDVLTGIQENC